MIFFWKIVPNWVSFGQGEGFKLTTKLPEKVKYPHNQAIKNGLNEALLILNCFSRVFDGVLVSEGVIIQNRQGGGDPSIYHLKGLLLTFVPLIMMTEQQFKRFKVAATMLNDAGETNYASSTTTMSLFKEKLTSMPWSGLMGMRNAAWRVSHKISQ